MLLTQLSQSVIQLSAKHVFNKIHDIESSLAVRVGLRPGVEADRGVAEGGQALG